LAQLALWQASPAYAIGIHLLPKSLDETVARLHLLKLGGRLTELTAVQAEYLGVSKSGPFKADDYRY